MSQKASLLRMRWGNVSKFYEYCGDNVNLESAQSVAQVVWPWRSPPKSPASGARIRRRRVLIQCGIMIVIASLVTWWLRRYRLGQVLYFVSAIIAICGFLMPKAFDVFERLVQTLAHAVGVILTWLLLVPFFYLCFAPARLVMMLLNKDPMARRYEHDRLSYWEDRKPPTPQSYTRQY